MNNELRFQMSTQLSFRYPMSTRVIYYSFDTALILIMITVIIIIIIIFITSAALSKIRHAAGTCHSVLTKRCAFRRRAKVALDSVDRRSSAGKLFQVSGPQTAKFLRQMAVAVRCIPSHSCNGVVSNNVE